jgi:hypothetical protein
MKWFIFAAAVASILPIIAWVRGDVRKLVIIWVAIGALPFVSGAFPKYKIVLDGDPEWIGITQGFDVSALDLVLMAAFFSLPRGRYAAVPFKIPFALYTVAVVLSAYQAPHSTESLWYAWQVLRMFIAFSIVAKACTDARITVALLKGLAIGVCFEAAIVGWQRFIEHTVQATGTFTAQNVLGMALHFVIYPFFALFLSGEKGWQSLSVPIMGVAMAIFTASRGTVLASITGLALLFAMSMQRKRRWTPRMTRILAAAVLTLAILSPVAYRQFGYRYQGVSGAKISRHILTTYTG